jgi:hypothetical protein
VRDLFEISNVIRSEVAKCKGTLPDAIGTDVPLIEEIGLHGDDFIAVAAYVHRKYNVRPRKDAYGVNLTIEEWARIVAECE